MHPLGIVYLQTLCFMLIIIGLAPLVKSLLRRLFRGKYRATGGLLPLITINSAVLGIALTVIIKELDLLSTIVYSLAAALGFGLVLIVFSAIQEQLMLTRIPRSMRGAPIALITAGLLAMAFMGIR